MILEYKPTSMTVHRSDVRKVYKYTYLSRGCSSPIGSSRDSVRTLLYTHDVSV